MTDTCYSKMTTYYIIVGFRADENYYAELVSVCKEVPAVFAEVLRANGDQLIHTRTPTPACRADHWIITRCDVTAEDTHIYVRFTRWKYEGCTVRCSTKELPPRPSGMHMLSDCTYESTVTLSSSK